MNYNKLIAEFMGGWNDNKNSKHLGMNVPAQGNPHWENQWYDYKDMKYQSSWDWLMPVVDKIESINHSTVEIKGTKCNISYHDTNGFWNHKIGKGRTKIKSTHKAVVEFIKWYNLQKT